jgi:multidrug efflux system membrane fusion protein
VNARLLLTTRKAGITIPASAVQRGPNGSYVYVIAQDQTAEMRPVTVVQTQSDKSLIDQGVEKGEKVVVDGQYKLQPGAHVEITQPGAKPGKSGPGGRPGGHRPPAGQPGSDAEKKNAAANEPAPAVDGKERPAGTPTRFRANKPAAQ